jgi:hypothetical protein
MTAWDASGGVHRDALLSGVPRWAYRAGDAEKLAGPELGGLELDEKRWDAAEIRRRTRETTRS